MKWVGGWKSSRASSSSLGQPLPMIDWHWFDPCLLNCLFGSSRWSWSASLAAGGFVHGGRGRIIRDKLPAFLCLVWHAHHFEHGQDLMRTHFLHGIRQNSSRLFLGRLPQLLEELSLLSFLLVLERRNESSVKLLRILSRMRELLPSVVDPLLLLLASCVMVLLMFDSGDGKGKEK